jgi:hypothetical protein
MREDQYNDEIGLYDYTDKEHVGYSYIINDNLTVVIVYERENDSIDQANILDDYLRDNFLEIEHHREYLD